MNIIKVNKEYFNDLVPKVIMESDVISKNSKLVLATIINYITKQPKAKELGYLVISNEDLRKSCGISFPSMMDSIAQLQDYELITRKAGTSRVNGETARASSYYINWDNMTKEPKKITAEDLIRSMTEKYKNNQVPTVEESAIAADAAVSSFESPVGDDKQSQGIEEFECSVGEFSKKEKDDMHRFNEAVRYLRIRNSMLERQGKNSAERNEILSDEVYDKYANGENHIDCFKVQELYDIIKEELAC